MNDIKTNLNRTIDLAGIINNERQDFLIKNGYLADFTLTEKFIMRFPKITKFLLICGACLVVLAVLIPISETNASEGNILSIRDQIRLERLEICQKAYKNSGINEQFIYDQIPAVRCATYMGLIYAYESNFGKSRKCIEDKNCHGMKGNGYDTPRGFLTFKSHSEGKEYFAKKYFKWHYKKNIKTFVYNWSMTDRETYINFVSSRYWNMYKELEYFYLTGK